MSSAGGLVKLWFYLQRPGYGSHRCKSYLYVRPHKYETRDCSAHIERERSNLQIFFTGTLEIFSTATDKRNCHRSDPDDIMRLSAEVIIRDSAHIQASCSRVCM